eukprot:TRINITY_DN2477_c0_g1_i8.p1 TRINITY_DN2477_c0_g1~~TRINITY_DN2477_c0_g1_i8.p1  ORF type:complete len:150 (-),score=26.09 TRINITY_DN2477_c0_g1_i8:42-491(-)
MEAHQTVPKHQQYGAIGYCLAAAKVPVGHIATNDWHHVNKACIGPVDHAGFFSAEKVIFHQIKHKDCAHAIVGESLPHFCQKAYHQPDRVAKKLALLRPFGRNDCVGHLHPLYYVPVSYTHLRAHETVLDLVCRLLLEKKKKKKRKQTQ